MRVSVLVANIDRRVGRNPVPSGLALGFSNKENGEYYQYFSHPAMPRRAVKCPIIDLGRGGPEIFSQCWDMRKTSEIIWQDAQHQVLFEILDLIKEPGSDRLVLEKLRDYTENHFALEELYMLQLGYPDREAHVQAHNRFRQEIDKLLTSGQEHDAIFMEIIATFLTEWLTRHVFGVDKKLEDYLLLSKAK